MLWKASQILNFPQYEEPHIHSSQQWLGLVSIQSILSLDTIYYESTNRF